MNDYHTCNFCGAQLPVREREPGIFMSDPCGCRTLGGTPSNAEQAFRAQGKASAMKPIYVAGGPGSVTILEDDQEPKEEVSFSATSATIRPGYAPEKGTTMECQHCKTLKPGDAQSCKCIACAANREAYAASAALRREFATPEDYVSYQRARAQGRILELPAHEIPNDEADLILGRGEIDEVKAKLKFAADKALKAEFYNSEAAYIAYLKAESRGETKTVRQ